MTFLLKWLTTVGLAFAALVLNACVLLESSTDADQSPFWSPDARRIAFVSVTVSVTGNHIMIHIMNADGSDQRRLTEGHFGDQPRATPWSPDGNRIAFVRTGDSRPGLYAMKADGSELTRITQAHVKEFAWSPGAQLALVTSPLESPGRYDLFVVNQDGSGLRRLTHDDESESQLAWSPDGQKVAYVSFSKASSEICIVMLDDGAHPRCPASAMGTPPSWSPDSSRVAFVSPTDGKPDVSVVNADGSGLTNLTNHPAADDWPAWSPDGRSIAFVSDRDGQQGAYTMRPDGSSANWLAEPGRPVWSPDGARLAVQVWKPGLPAVPSSVSVVNSDGSNEVKLIESLRESWGVFQWSPDSTRIVFVRPRSIYHGIVQGTDRKDEIFVVNADGSGMRQLTRN